MQKLLNTFFKQNCQPIVACKNGCVGNEVVNVAIYNRKRCGWCEMQYMLQNNYLQLGEGG